MKLKNLFRSLFWFIPTKEERLEKLSYKELLDILRNESHIDSESCALIGKKLAEKAKTFEEWVRVCWAACFKDATTHEIAQKRMFELAQTPKQWVEVYRTERFTHSKGKRALGKIAELASTFNELVEIYPNDMNSKELEEFILSRIIEISRKGVTLKQWTDAFNKVPDHSMLRKLALDTIKGKSGTNREWMYVHYQCPNSNNGQVLKKFAFSKLIETATALDERLFIYEENYKKTGKEVDIGEILNRAITLEELIHIYYKAYTELKRLALEKIGKIDVAPEQWLKISASTYSTEIRDLALSKVALTTAARVPE
jgi:hypothetical protein